MTEATNRPAMMRRKKLRRRSIMGTPGDGSHGCTSRKVYVFTAGRTRIIRPGTHHSNARYPLADRVTEAAVLVLTALGWAVLGYVVIALPVSPGTQAVFYTAGFVAL